MIASITVAAVTTLYMDDSGTRNPNHDSGTPSAGKHDWFALGGILVDERDEDAVRDSHQALRKKWRLTVPLHSYEIRTRRGNFHWLEDRSPEDRAAFQTDLDALVTRSEITAIACVVDRPGYGRRYTAKYGREQWLLCKTAFMVVVERAAKVARERGSKLRVYVEKADKKTDRILLDYYNHLRSTGSPFDPESSAKYAPLAAAEFAETLYEFRTKEKSSPLIQLADLCLWPMCMGGYEPTLPAYRLLVEAGTLIDCKLPDAGAIAERGIKYSCWS